MLTLHLGSEIQSLSDLRSVVTLQVKLFWLAAGEAMGGFRLLQHFQRWELEPLTLSCLSSWGCTGM